MATLPEKSPIFRALMSGFDEAAKSPSATDAIRKLVQKTISDAGHDDPALRESVEALVWRCSRLTFKQAAELALFAGRRSS